MRVWPYGPTEFSAPGGADTLVELSVPARGTINSIRLLQLGAAGSATFRIFSSQDAAEAAAGSAGSTSLAGSDPDSYSVMGQKQLVNGVFEEYGRSYGYQNRDGTPTNQVRKLWLVMTPDGIGDNDYALSMEIERPTLLG